MVKVTICWPRVVTTVPMPLTAGPSGASASTCQIADPLTPPADNDFQLTPEAEVQMTTSCEAVSPPAAKPAGLAVRAVTVVPGPAGPNGAHRQVRPPSAESSTNGTVLVWLGLVWLGLAWPGTAWPGATTVGPLTATCRRTAVLAPPGTGRTVASQERPSAVVHIAG